MGVSHLQTFLDILCLETEEHGSIFPCSSYRDYMVRPCRTVDCRRHSPASSTWLSLRRRMGSCNLALPTLVCENYVPSFPSSGSPTRSPITIAERVLEQELPNDSQGSPSSNLHPTTPPFFFPSA